MTENGNIIEVVPSFLEGDRFDVSGKKVCLGAQRNRSVFVTSSAVWSHEA